MAKRPPPPPPASPILNQGEALSAINRLEKRIKELEAFDIKTLTGSTSAELSAIGASIQTTLSRIFGDGTQAYNRYSSAAELAFRGPMFLYSGMPPTPLAEKQQGVAENIKKSVALLKSAIDVLREEIEATTFEAPSIEIDQRTEPTDTSRVFVVHGHDDAVKESVARFVEKIGFEPIILHEQASGGKTTIEKVVHYGRVGFAVVLLTPDDQGGPVGGDLKPRARQNVILELGYFLGLLGRSRVCALVKNEIERPSDFEGVVYVPYDPAGGWKSALAKELQEAGFSVDWNLVMR